jgi:hypothetical protein
MSGYGYIAACVGFVACRVDEVRRTPAMRRRRVTLGETNAVGSGEEGSSGAVVVGGE